MQTDETAPWVLELLATLPPLSSEDWLAWATANTPPAEDT